LVIAIDAAAPDFQASFDQTIALLAQPEVLTWDVRRCLRLAIRRALATGFPERAAQIRQFSAAIAARSGPSDGAAQFS
jgi:hypothetical protein